MLLSITCAPDKRCWYGASSQSNVIQHHRERVGDLGVTGLFPSLLILMPAGVRVTCLSPPTKVGTPLKLCTYEPLRSPVKGMILKDKNTE